MYYWIDKIFASLQVIGLILDIIGAYYLAKSFINKSIKDLAAESWGDNYPEKGYPGGMSENQFVSFYKQSIEAKTGFIILTLGFMSQVCGYLFLGFRINRLIGISIIALAILIPILRQRIMFHKDRIKKLSITTQGQSVQWKE